MTIALSIVLSVITISLGLWLAVRVVGGSDEQNSLMMSTFVGVVFGLFGAVAGPFGYFMLFGLFLLLLRYYELGLLQSILVMVVVGALNFLTQLGLGLVLQAAGLL